MNKKNGKYLFQQFLSFTHNINERKEKEKKKENHLNKGRD